MTPEQIRERFSAYIRDSEALDTMVALVQEAVREAVAAARAEAIEECAQRAYQRATIEGDAITEIIRALAAKPVQEEPPDA